MRLFNGSILSEHDEGFARKVGVVEQLLRDTGHTGITWRSCENSDKETGKTGKGADAQQTATNRAIFFTTKRILARMNNNERPSTWINLGVHSTVRSKHERNATPPPPLPAVVMQLTRSQKEVIALGVSLSNQCPHCAFIHTAMGPAAGDAVEFGELRKFYQTRNADEAFSPHGTRQQDHMNHKFAKWSISHRDGKRQSVPCTVRKSA